MTTKAKGIDVESWRHTHVTSVNVSIAIAADVMAAQVLRVLEVSEIYTK